MDYLRAIDNLGDVLPESLEELSIGVRDSWQFPILISKNLRVWKIYIPSQSLQFVRLLPDFPTVGILFDCETPASLQEIKLFLAPISQNLLREYLQMQSLRKATLRVDGTLQSLFELLENAKELETLKVETAGALEIFKRDRRVEGSMFSAFKRDIKATNPNKDLPDTIAELFWGGLSKSLWNDPMPHLKHLDVELGCFTISQISVECLPKSLEKLVLRYGSKRDEREAMHVLLPFLSTVQSSLKSLSFEMSDKVDDPVSPLPDSLISELGGFSRLTSLHVAPVMILFDTTLSSLPKTLTSLRLKNIESLGGEKVVGRRSNMRKDGSLAPNRTLEEAKEGALDGPFSDLPDALIELALEFDSMAHEANLEEKFFFKLPSRLASLKLVTPTFWAFEDPETFISMLPTRLSGLSITYTALKTIPRRSKFVPKNMSPQGWADLRIYEIKVLTKDLNKYIDEYYASDPFWSDIGDSKMRKATFEVFADY